MENTQSREVIRRALRQFGNLIPAEVLNRVINGVATALVAEGLYEEDQADFMADEDKKVEDAVVEAKNQAFVEKLQDMPGLATEPPANMKPRLEGTTVDGGVLTQSDEYHIKKATKAAETVEEVAVKSTKKSDKSTKKSDKSTKKSESWIETQ